ncbi:hypothetical protein SAMN05444141_11314 [Pseudovibrio denitrificans]|uniref:Uncharacterized protein n=1 Tax=Pseudovibrio denitrificans TaxID=258256 RepID=A0A1I7DYJ8_9HYPH|nr:hypothetical protein [Pseudovibrio denitrificans]SFU16741.1 hypothetical protein SAMN05444141_11314 [Pseudovibrio denitrificans]
MALAWGEAQNQFKLVKDRVYKSINSGLNRKYIYNVLRSEGLITMGLPAFYKLVAKNINKKTGSAHCNSAQLPHNGSINATLSAFTCDCIKPRSQDQLSQVSSQLRSSEDVYYVSQTATPAAFAIWDTGLDHLHIPHAFLCNAQEYDETNTKIDASEYKNLTWFLSPCGKVLLVHKKKNE